MPQRFRFRLEPVRALSERREEEARGALAVALADESAARVRLQDAVERSAAAVRELGEHMTSGPVTGDALRAREAWIARTTEQHEAMLLDVDRRVTESDARRGLLAGAARDREVLERLRGRRQAEHQAVEDRAEQERLDEIAIGMHRRRAA